MTAAICAIPATSPTTKAGRTVVSVPGVGPITALAFNNRPARPIPAIAGRGGSSRPDPVALPIWRDRHSGQGQQMRQRTRPHCPLRSRPHAAGEEQKVVEPARAWGTISRKPAWYAPGSRLPANSPSSCTACGATKSISDSARIPARPQPSRSANRKEKQQSTNRLERANRIVPVGTMCQARRSY